ncbi:MULTISPECIES: DMT family transporter [unclassified Sulfitobacter]|uniref:DMT family transporter n=1 Tax=unclassified Sulfitobacter TaxID=196795 RepID=UPI00082F81EE|nr:MULTISPECIES: DMT family transporter [unclassified Sulfitobacter]
MTSLWIFAAIGTAACFAISSLLAYDAARTLGAIVFSFLRMSLVAVGFAVLALTSGFDTSLSLTDISLLVLSGILGVFLADTLRYASLARIGPALQSLLNTTTAPFALVLGFVILGQVVSELALFGTAIVFGGLVLAIFSRNFAALTRFSGERSNVTGGVLFGLASALSQAGSVLIAAPVMLDGADLVSATFIRSLAGSLSLLLPVVLSAERKAQIGSMPKPVVGQVFLSAAIGTGLGMTLQLYALSSGPVGVVSTLAATTPLIILPLIWVLGKARPPGLAWIGAICAVAGVTLIVNAG